MTHCVGTHEFGDSIPYWGESLLAQNGQVGIIGEVFQQEIPSALRVFSAARMKVQLIQQDEVSI